MNHAIGPFTVALLTLSVLLSSPIHAEETPPPFVAESNPAAPIPIAAPAPTPADHPAALSLFSTPILATASTGVTTWTEDAESGTTNVIDGTDASYSLIQSNVFSQGANAFHLAHPNAAPNLFTLDVDIDVQADTKLFFQSRLRTATSDQTARVQLSTDGGSTWPVNLYSQPGSGSGGEGAFVLREIDLSAYAGQQIRLRFNYDFAGGSLFPQTSSSVGWFIDDIQIGPSFQKALYSIGNPSATAVAYLEIINRARADALTEANRLAAATDPSITGAYSFFGITPADIVTQYQWYYGVGGCMDQFAQPLAFQSLLNETAELHSLDMLTNVFQGHTSSASPPAPYLPGDSLGQRLDRVGYSWSSIGENVFAFASSPEQGHAGFAVDWGNSTNTASSCYNAAFVGQGMQNPAGHRIAIHNNNYNEAGIGVINDSNSNGPASVGPQIVTQVFSGVTGVSYICGVIYDDDNADNFYTANSDTDHEGRGGIRVDVDGSGVYTMSSNSGAYAIPVTSNGDYTVTFSGPDIETYQTVVTVANGLNTKLGRCRRHRPHKRRQRSTWHETQGARRHERPRRDGHGDFNCRVRVGARR
ncbi:MAG: hypothetical protein AAF591_07215, partial [Verrucomicrobiota bacterium]